MEVILVALAEACEKYVKVELSVERYMANPTSFVELSAQFSIIEVAPTEENVKELGDDGVAGVKVKRVPDVIARVLVLLAVPNAQVEEADVAFRVTLEKVVVDVPKPIDAPPEFATIPLPYTKSIVPVDSFSQH